MKNVLLLKAGDAAQAVRLSPSGDYDRWFVRATADARVRFTIVRPYLGEPLPRDPRAFDAVWMTGSPLSVTQPCAWMRPAGEYLREAAERGVPVLGVCFGQQLLAHVYGAKVAKNPNGREIGTVEISLTAEGRTDPLFTDFDARFTANATHEDAVLTLPEGWVRLAGNANTPLQAIGYRDHVRAVQFHPELSADGMREIVLARSFGLECEAREKGHPGNRTGEVLAGIRPAPLAPRLLTNFVRWFC